MSYLSKLKKSELRRFAVDASLNWNTLGRFLGKNSVISELRLKSGGEKCFSTLHENF